MHVGMQEATRCECEFSVNSAPDMQDYVSSCQSWSYDANHCDGAVSECITQKELLRFILPIQMKF